MSTSSELRFTFVAFVFIGACATSERAASPERTQPATAAVPATTPPGAAGPGSAEQPAAAPPAGVAPALVAPDPVTGTAAARVAELSAKAQALVDAFLNSEALLTRDGKQVVFVSNRDGLPQIYLADAARPDSPAKRLLESKERVTLDETTPDGKSILFRSDRGADEKWSVFRAGLNGSAPVELTTGERMQRDRVRVADLAPDTIYFSARRISDVGSTVLAASATAAGPAREVYRDAKPGFLTAVSRDGKQGLFLRYPSRSENHLLRIDLASGKTKELYPGSGKVSIEDAQFSPDGRTVYVATDGGGEQAWLLALDA